MKYYFWILTFVAPLFTSAQTTAPLIEAYRSLPEVQEDYVLLDNGAQEELRMTANYFSLPQQEFGAYVRSPSDLPVRVEKLKNSLSGTDYKIPAQKSFNMHGWHVTIKGEEIDATDPRFTAALELLKNQIRSETWTRKDVTSGELKGGRLVITRTRYPLDKSKNDRAHSTKAVMNGLEACGNAVGNRLVCHIPKHGFIYLAGPDERKKQ